MGKFPENSGKFLENRKNFPKNGSRRALFGIFREKMGSGAPLLGIFREKWGAARPFWEIFREKWGKISLHDREIGKNRKKRAKNEINSRTFWLRPEESTVFHEFSRIGARRVRKRSGNERNSSISFRNFPDSHRSRTERAGFGRKRTGTFGRSKLHGVRWRRW